VILDHAERGVEMIVRTIRVLLQLAGGLCVVLAMLAAAAPMTSPIQGPQPGEGLLLLEVQLLTMIAVGWGALGVFLLWLGSLRFEQQLSPLSSRRRGPAGGAG
jgi:hypothetical protein